MSIGKGERREKVLCQVHASRDTMAVQIPKPERFPFKDIQVIGDQLDALKTDILKTLVVRKVEVSPIRSGAIKVSDGGFFVVKTSPKRSFGLPGILATTTCTRKNIDDRSRVASDMLLDFEFGSRDSTGYSRTMDSMGLADKATFITTREESRRGM